MSAAMIFGDTSDEKVWCNMALVDPEKGWTPGVEDNVWTHADHKEDGGFGSPSSLLFYLLPTDMTKDTIRLGITTCKLAHMPPPNSYQRNPRQLFLSSVHEAKPILTQLQKYGAVRDSIVGSAEEEASAAAGGGTGRVKKSSGANLRLVFSAEDTSVNVLKLIPLSPTETDQVETMLSFLPIFALYAYRYKSEPQPPLDMCEDMIRVSLDLVDVLTKGAAPPRRHKHLMDYIHEANDMMPAEFAALFGGEADAKMQQICYETKVMDAVFEAALAPCKHHFHRYRTNPKTTLLYLLLV